MFQVIDFVIFGLFLLLSILVGVYHGIKAKFVKYKHSSTDEYLTGGHNLPIFPVCLSLLTTFISGIALLGIPAEIYLRGASMGAAHLLGAVGFFIVGYFFIPMFYKLRFTNVYEYFEYRFNSLFLRSIGTFMFVLNTSIYMAIVIYAPAIALSGAANLPLWPFILAVGSVGTIYTAVGGIKAVIWTDTLQAFFLIFGLAMLLIKGTIDAGGLQSVIQSAEETGRLSGAIFRFDPNPFQYNNFWIAVIGGILHSIGMFGLNQMALQRYCSMPSLKKANTVMALAVPSHIIVGCMAMYLGLLIFAYFHGCDPISLGEVETPDQLSIVLAVKVLGSLPGMPGLFLSTIFSATLSTLSSGLNSIVAVLWEDLLKHHYEKKKSSVKPEHLMKCIVVFLGIVTTCMAFACKLLGGIFQVAVATLGATSGPIAGLFFLGLFFPSANRNGAIAGFFTSSVLMIMISLFYNMEKPYEDYILSMHSRETPSPACPINQNFTELINDYYWNRVPENHYGSIESSTISRLSPFSYAISGILFTVVIGLLVSWIWPQKLSQQRKNIAYACTYRGLNTPIDKFEKLPTSEPIEKQ